MEAQVKKVQYILLNILNPETFWIHFYALAWFFNYYVENLLQKIISNFAEHLIVQAKNIFFIKRVDQVAYEDIAHF